MTDYVNNHLARHPGRVRPRLVCADGFSLSIQAGEGLYSSPPGATTGCTSVEVGYPERPDGSGYKPRAFGRFDGAVCGWVPVPVLNRWIKAHGGANNEEGANQ